MPRATVNYALAATLLSQGLNYDQAAQQVGAKNGNSLKVGLSRRGVTLSATRGSDFAIQRATVVANTIVSEASERLRGDFAELLQAHVGKLKELKPSSNLKKAKQLAEVLKPLSDTAKTVHGWGAGDERGAISVGWMNAIDSNNPGEIGATESNKAIEVQSEVVTDSPIKR